jgi:two-component system cell cycle sensor histidine kinase/response regulator CckA
MSQDQPFVQRAIKLLGRVIPDVVIHLDAEGRLLSNSEGSSGSLLDLLVPFHGMHVHKCAALIDLVDPGLTQKLRETIDTTLRDREPAHATFQLRWPNPDSPAKHYDLRSLPLVDQTLILVRDTTSERALHEQLNISERMASLGTLAAGVAHEINNPLTYIQCNIVLAVEEVNELLELPELALLTERIDSLREVRDSLSVALEGTQRVAKITSELKHFSRVDKLKAKPLALQDLLESAIGLASNEIRHRAELHTYYAPSLPLTFGDPYQLTQVFINLLVNAAQSFDAVEVEAPSISVSVSDEDGQLIVAICDNGEGMNEDTLRRVFDPFFTTKANTGTGLGLSVSHRIVHDLGGSLRAESRPGVGTTMTVTLPHAPSLSPLGSEPRLTLESPRAVGATIMVIEDEPLIQSLLERLLDHHDVHIFTSLQQAITQLEVLTPHAIICDLMLPGEGGEHLHRHLRAHAPDLMQRTLFMTGGAFTPGAELFLNTVQPRLLRKPFKSEDLIDQVDDILHIP